jgi:hypothetical protein
MQGRTPLLRATEQINKIGKLDLRRQSEAKSENRERVNQKNRGRPVWCPKEPLVHGEPLYRFILVHGEPLYWFTLNRV